MLSQIMPAFRMTLVLTVLTGMLYPGLVTALCRTLFPEQAAGSLVVREGRTVGSALLGQEFTGAAYFHPRPSAVGYDAAASGGSNLGPTSQKLLDRVKASVAAYRAENPTHRGAVPADAVTTSASGLDPHISQENAWAQAARVAEARKVALEVVLAAVAHHTEGQRPGLPGEAAVNVLLLNLELDRIAPRN